MVDMAHQAFHVALLPISGQMHERRPAAGRPPCAPRASTRRTAWWCQATPQRV